MSSVKYMKKIDAGEAFHIDPDSGVENMTFSRKRSRKEKLLFAALFIVLVVAIVFIVLYVLQVSKSKSESPTTPATTTRTGTAAISPTKSGYASSACNPADCVVIASGQFENVFKPNPALEKLYKYF